MTAGPLDSPASRRPVRSKRSHWPDDRIESIRRWRLDRGTGSRVPFRVDGAGSARSPDREEKVLGPVSFRSSATFFQHAPPLRAPGVARPLPSFVLARLPRHLRAPPLRALSLLPPPHSEPLGRRGSRAGRDGARVRDARTDGERAAEPARVALSGRVESLVRPAAKTPARRAS